MDGFLAFPYLLLLRCMFCCELYVGSMKFIDVLGTILIFEYWLLVSLTVPLLSNSIGSPFRAP